MPLKPIPAMTSEEQVSLLSNINCSNNKDGRPVLHMRGDRLRDNSMHSFGSPLQHVPDPHMTLTDSEPSPLNGDLHACASTIQLGPGSTLPTPQPFDLFAGGAGPRPTADSTPPFRCQHHTTPALMQTSRLQNDETQQKDGFYSYMPAPSQVAAGSAGTRPAGGPIQVPGGGVGVDPLSFSSSNTHSFPTQGFPRLSFPPHRSGMAAPPGPTEQPPNSSGGGLQSDDAGPLAPNCYMYNSTRSTCSTTRTCTTTLLLRGPAGGCCPTLHGEQLHAPETNPSDEQ